MCTYFEHHINKCPWFIIEQAGHSVGARPNPIPNLEVKPNVAIVLLRCESSWEAIVLAFLFVIYKWTVIAKDMPVDPVCGIELDEELALVHHHKGKVYYFCCNGCRRIFLKPRRWR